MQQYAGFEANFLTFFSLELADLEDSKLEVRCVVRGSQGSEGDAWCCICIFYLYFYSVICAYWGNAFMKKCTVLEFIRSLSSNPGHSK